MIIKVCGIKTRENIEFLSKTKIDMVGLNFYAPSVRYISPDTDENIFNAFYSDVKRVGVFVNEAYDQILTLSAKYRLDYVQLHGDEEESFCKRIAAHLPVIKVFRVDESFDFSESMGFESADMFLFDTRTKNYGGSGKQFDWSILNNYKGQKRFLLSGGIGPGDEESILKLNHKKFAGIDINSKFESSPGIKDESLILPFLNKMENKR